MMHAILLLSAKARLRTLIVTGLLATTGIVGFVALLASVFLPLFNATRF